MDRSDQRTGLPGPDEIDLDSAHLEYQVSRRWLVGLHRGWNLPAWREGPGGMIILPRAWLESEFGLR